MFIVLVCPGSGRNSLGKFLAGNLLAESVACQVSKIGQTVEQAEYVQGGSPRSHTYGRIALFKPSERRTGNQQSVCHHFCLDTPTPACIPYIGTKFLECPLDREG